MPLFYGWPDDCSDLFQRLISLWVVLDWVSYMEYDWPDSTSHSVVVLWFENLPKLLGWEE